MSAGGHGAACGVVLGIVIVIFLQQVGTLGLSELVPSLEFLIAGALIGGILGGLIGWGLGRAYLSRQDANEASSSN